MINLKINGVSVSVPAGTTILEAARMNNIDIPTLCFLKEINAIGACRICVVENRVNGMGRLVAACVFPVAEGMEVYTHSPMVQKARKQTLELILSDHDKKCLSCVRSGSCELQRLCNEYGVDKEDAFNGDVNTFAVDDSAVHMVRDNNNSQVIEKPSREDFQEEMTMEHNLEGQLELIREYQAEIID